VTLPTGFTPNPDLDLVLAREVDVPPEKVWAAWTQPDLLTRWFAPAPYTTSACEIDLRPGGIFRTVMRSPEGEESDGAGCFLEVVENERLTWTSALGPGFRPEAAEDLAFHRHHLPGAHPVGHPLHRGGPAQRGGGLRPPRRDGLPRGLGHGARPARRPGEGGLSPGLQGAEAHRLGPTDASGPDTRASWNDGAAAPAEMGAGLSVGETAVRG